MCGWGKVRGGQKLASRAKVWSALSTPTPDIEYSLMHFLNFSLKADCFHPLKQVANFVVSTAAEGNQELVAAELDVVAHHAQIHPNEFNREGINNKFHLNVNCTADNIDDGFFGKTVSQFGVEEACKVTVEPFVAADKFVAEAKARHESMLFYPEYSTERA
jgi:hypothetical protein